MAARLMFLGIAVALLLPPAALAERGELSQQRCFSWEILQGDHCVSCPPERQVVVQGRDVCAPPGGIDDDDGDQDADPLPLLPNLPPQPQRTD